MFALALILVLAAEPGAPALSIAAPGLAVTGLDPALSAPFTDHLAKAFAPIRVITPRDMAALIGLERQKELLGCAVTGQCLVELGNALGVQGVLVGDVVKVGGVIQINVRVIDAAGGKQLAAASERVETEAWLFDALTRVGLDLRPQFYRAMGVFDPPPPQVAAPVSPTAPRSRVSRKLSIIPWVLGAAGIVTGATFFSLSESSYQRLAAGMPGSVSIADATVIAQNGKLMRTAGIVAISLAATALLVGIALLVFGGP